jgi:hypothetical protein
MLPVHAATTMLSVLLPVTITDVAAAAAAAVASLGIGKRSLVAMCIMLAVLIHSTA